MLSGRERALFIAHTGTFAALFAIGSLVSIPFVPVPLTLQTLFLFVAAGFMGRYAVAPILLYLLLGTLGFPVFHNGTAGIGVFLGPTGGFLLGFVPAVFVSGLCFERHTPLVQWAGMGVAAAIYYVCGVAWLVFSSGLSLSAAVLVGVVPFIPGDLLKAFAAYTVNARFSRVVRAPKERGIAK